MTYDDEILMRRIDGELSPTEASPIDAAAATDQQLAARLEAMRTLRASVREGFPTQPDVRDHDLARLIASSGPRRPHIDWMTALAEAFAPRTAALWGGLVTAAFIGGLVLGPLLGGTNEGVRVRAGGALADPGLTRVLDNRLTSQGADHQGRTVGLTFRDSEGRWCRTFAAGDAGLAGLACREDEAWTIRVLTPLGGRPGEIRTAASETPELILSAVDASLADQTLDAAGERAARDGGWR